MEKITVYNYEAFFLDFSEGALNPGQVELLEAFLKNHPDLRDELDGFEAIRLSQETDGIAGAWNKLKRPNLGQLKADLAVREALYCSAIDNQLNRAEQTLLDSLLLDKNFALEFETWTKLRLQADAQAFEEKDGIYRFGLAEPVSTHNYEAYLIAFGENLLDAGQAAHLEAFATNLPEGQRDLAMAKSLRLKPARGIVFPDKASLRKEQKAAPWIWLYRAAAVLLLGGAVWFLLPDRVPQDQPISENVKSAADTATIETPSIAPADSLNQNLQPERLPVSIEEWEAREPDPVEYAHIEKEIKTVRNEELDINWPAEPIDYRDIEGIEPKNAQISRPLLAQGIALEGQKGEQREIKKSGPEKDEYKTLAAIAEEKIADKLALSDSERDAFAMSLAKRFTDKAGELLDTEVERESRDDASGERITYTLRVGGFKVSHNKAK